MTSRYLPRINSIFKWFTLPTLLLTSFAQAVECEWQYISQWNGGATAEIQATNNSDAVVDLDHFTAEFPGGVTVQHVWNASVSGSNPYTFIPSDWNAQLQPGAGMVVGMQVSTPSGVPASENIPVLGGDCSDQPVPEGSLSIAAKDKVLAGSADDITVTLVTPSLPSSQPLLSVSPYAEYSYMSSTGGSNDARYIMGYYYRVSYDNPGTYLWRAEYEQSELVAEHSVEVFPVTARPTVSYQMPELIYAGQPFSLTIIGEDTELLESLTLTPPSGFEFSLQSSDRQSDTLWRDVYIGELPAGEHLIYIEAEDPDGFFQKKQVTVNVLPFGGDNTPPVADIYFFADFTANDTVSFRAAITDAENNIANARMIIFQIVDGARVNPQEIINRDYDDTGDEILFASWATSMAGAYELEVIVTDADGERGVDTASFTVAEDEGGSISFSFSGSEKVIVDTRQSVGVFAYHPTRIPYEHSLSIEPYARANRTSSSSSGGGGEGYTRIYFYEIAYDYPGTYLLTATSAGLDPVEKRVEVFPVSARPTARIEVPENIYENQEFTLTVIAEDTEALESVFLSYPSDIEFTLQSKDYSSDTYWVETYTGALNVGTYNFSVRVEDSDSFTWWVNRSVEVKPVVDEPPEVLWCDWFGYDVPVCEDHSLTDFQWINDALCIGYQTCGESRIFSR
ncbi:cellulose binding domain-containing protein [Teredinibacter turnerae]|uniref:cellulose binding domain-containing protein n=1 Tax=Teredinibacter turnerae TaxID=2426 RepID=UPI000491EF34|nr:cellulose binding domain-containing protein [Teredinibacter turnerae]